jgi:hypothetical protein
MRVGCLVVELFNSMQSLMLPVMLSLSAPVMLSLSAPVMLSLSAPVMLSLSKHGLDPFDKLRVTRPCPLNYTL